MNDEEYRKNLRTRAIIHLLREETEAGVVVPLPAEVESGLSSQELQELRDMVASKLREDIPYSDRADLMMYGGPWMRDRAEPASPSSEESTESESDEEE